MLLTQNSLEGGAAADHPQSAPADHALQLPGPALSRARGHLRLAGTVPRTQEESRQQAAGAADTPVPGGLESGRG